MASVIWQFLNSSVGQGLVLYVAGRLLAKAVKSKPRQDRILEYARDAFDIAERAGELQGLDGVAKAALYLKELAEGMRKRGEKPLTETETELVKRRAYEKAWITKTAKKS